MDKSISKRIEQLIKAEGLKKYQFAQMLNINSSYVTILVQGRNFPSLRLVEDICEKFNVNEEWLLTGFGDMYAQKDEDEELVEWVARLTTSGMKDTLSRRFAIALSKMNEDELAVIAKFAENLAINKK